MGRAYALSRARRQIAKPLKERTGEVKPLRAIDARVSLEA